MKLEVGMYVKIIGGFISKITGFYENNVLLEDKQFVYLDGRYIGWTLADLKERTIKASNNIIDLIEVGDYVNGSKVSIVESEYIYWETGNAIHYKYIENIVTKEMFESISYKVN